jgi:hypothetical protein
MCRTCMPRDAEGYTFHVSFATCAASSLSATTTNIHPSLRLRLYGLYLHVNQPRQRSSRRMFPENLIPNLQ